MASDSVTPPPSSGGGSAKYIVILLLLLAGGLGVYLATSGAPAPAPVATPEPPKVERPTSLSDDTLVMPVDEPVEQDAGAPTPPPTKKPVRNTQAVDGWSCEGDIPTTNVRRVITDTQSAMRSCYERRLRNNNQLQGSISLQVHVNRDGRVDNTRTHGSMRDGEVLKCVQSLAKGWSFPAPTGGTCAVLDVPYNFTPKN